MIKIRFVSITMWLFAVFAIFVMETAHAHQVFQALDKGQFAKVRRLVKADPKRLTARDFAGDTLLHRAAEYGDVDLARFLIARGADVHAKDTLGNTPLDLAIRHYSTETEKMVKLLTAHGANVNDGGEGGWTPLHEAVWKDCQPSLLKLLIDRGARVNARTKDGKTPLDIADTRQTAIIAFLRQHGGKGNPQKAK